MAIELAQRGVLRGRLRFPRGFALELFGVLPGADLPAGLRRGRERADVARAAKLQPFAVTFHVMRIPVPQQESRDLLAALRPIGQQKS